VILKRQQKVDLVIKLAEEGKNTRELAQTVHMALKDIGAIIRRHLGEEENRIFR
jgi:Mor family transcriptional regulator